MTNQAKQPPASAHDQVLDQIQHGQVRMRPRWQFVILTILGVVGLVATAIVTVFLVNLVVYKLRLVNADRPLHAAQTELSYLAGSFPWLAFGIGLVCLGLFIWLWRRRDFSYRLGWWPLIVVVLLSLVVGIGLAFTNLNNKLQTFGPTRGFYGRQGQTNGNGNPTKGQSNQSGQRGGGPQQRGQN